MSERRRIVLGSENTTSTPIVKRGMFFKDSSHSPSAFKDPTEEENQVIDDSLSSLDLSEKENKVNAASSMSQIDESIIEMVDSFADLSSRDENSVVSERSRSQLSPIKFAMSPSPRKPRSEGKRQLDFEAPTPEPAGLPDIHIEHSIFGSPQAEKAGDDKAEEEELQASPPNDPSPRSTVESINHEPAEKSASYMSASAASPQLKSPRPVPLANDSMFSTGATDSPKAAEWGSGGGFAESDEEEVELDIRQAKRPATPSEPEALPSSSAGEFMEEEEEEALVIRRKRPVTPAAEISEEDSEEESKEESGEEDSDEDFIDDEAVESGAEEESKSDTEADEGSIILIERDEEEIKEEGSPVLETPTETSPPSFDYKGKEKLEAELQEYIRKMESLERIMASSDLSKAPDGGLKIMSSLSGLQAKVKQHTELLASMPAMPSRPKLGIKEKIAGGNWGKPMAATDGDWAKAPQTPEASRKPWTMPPAQKIDLKRLLADGHYGKHLFGGVMTAERMYTAKHVTMETVKNLHSSLQTIPADTDLSPDPRGLRNVALMPHQSWGLTWMLWREMQNPPGGILELELAADDMGLGKTLSIISLILKRRQDLKENPPTDQDLDRKRARLRQARLRDSSSSLVIAPASVANQWKSEIDKRTKHGRLRVLVYHGPARKKHNAHRHPTLPSPLDEAERRRLSLTEYDVVVTTYDVIASEVGPGKEEESEDEEEKDKSPGRHSSPLMKIAWDRIVLDEAHMIKNYNSRRAKAIFRLPGVNRWCLTGTPIHNKLKDLYALVRFLRVSPLDEISVWNEWVERETKISKDRLNTIVKAIVLRRTKDQVCTLTKKALVELPEKTLVVHELDLKAGEAEIYAQLFRASQLQAAMYLHSGAERAADLRSAVPGSSASSSLFKMSSASSGDNFAQMRAMLVMLLRLRQAAVHLHLVREGVEIGGLELDEATTTAASPDDLADSIANMSMEEEVLDAVIPEGAGLRAKDLFQPEWSSTKVDALIAEIRKIQALPDDDKIVIVSQWTSVLKKIILPQLRNLGDVGVTEITGEVPTNQRQERVDSFNKKGRDPRVMLLSLTAGGVGLNLTGANHLFILDLHWNPALEQQAMDRIYRMGQTKKVFIHKFVCKQTIEIRVNDLQKQKMELAKTVLSGAAKKNLSKLTLNDLRMLFELDGPAEAGNRQQSLFDKQRFAKPQPKSIYAPNN